MIAKQKYLGPLAVLAVVGLVGVAVSFWWVPFGIKPDARLDALQVDEQDVVLDVDTEARITAFCSDCHALPNPASFPRQRWHHEVRKGYEYYGRSGRNDLEVPPVIETLAYFQARAPKEVVFPEAVEATTDLDAKFAVEHLKGTGSIDSPPAVAFLRWTEMERGGPPVLLVCDMRSGSIDALDLHGGGTQARMLARLQHPCHIEPCDLDQDGRIDLVAAELGSLAAMDQDHGRVVWLRRQEVGWGFDEIAVISGLGRTADVRPLDVDGDGDLDLLVAEFGHYRTGGIYLLENVTAQGEIPRFELETLDSRPGTIHLPVHDFNHDGLYDFLALVSQEYECVDLFVNEGEGKFARCNVWTGPDLTFGSSGIELVDMDVDGDMDILYTNGDAFDNSYANPSHGVQWIENLGNLQFAYHRIADMPGAYRALAGDVDLDNDMDIICTAWLPEEVKPRQLRKSPLASILCLEQVSPGRFVRHTLKTGSPSHAALEMADFDDDGDLDFAVGWQAGLEKMTGREISPVSVWWNQASPAR